MSTKKWIFKDPADVADYGYNWAPLIGDTADTIVSTTCDVTTGTVVKSAHQVYTGQQTVTRLTGGTVGETCLLHLHIVCSSGQEFDQDIALPIKERR